MLAKTLVDLPAMGKARYSETESGTGRHVLPTPRTSTRSRSGGVKKVMPMVSTPWKGFSCEGDIGGKESPALW